MLKGMTRRRRRRMIGEVKVVATRRDKESPVDIRQGLE
jgi:hypothetical protein